MMFMPNTKWTWSFLGLSAAQACIGLALEGYVFGTFETSLHGDTRNSSSARTIITYLSLFIFGFLYQLLLVWDALRLKNTIQIIGLCLYNFGLLIYAAVQTDQIHDVVVNLSGPIQPEHVSTTSDTWWDIRPFLVAVPCIIALFTVLLSFVAWKLYDEFAWTIYKNISADVRMKRRYLIFQVYIALLKFDFFFFLSFTVQFLVVVTNTSDSEFYITIAALPITIVLLILAGYWTRRESVAGMCFTILLYFAAMAYFLFKLVRMYDTADGRVNDYLPARRGLTTFAVITVILLVITITNATWCMLNFGKGLKPYVLRRKVLGPEDKAAGYGGSSHNGDHQLDRVTTRMTID